MKVCVVGIGYVGLVSAGCLAEAGNSVICVDKDEEKIAGLKQGTIPIYEPGLAELVRRNLRVGRLSFTTDLKQGVDNSLIIFLAVGRRRRLTAPRMFPRSSRLRARSPGISGSIGSS